MRNPLNIRQSLLALALTLGAATTAFATPPAMPAKSTSPIAATAPAPAAKAAPATINMAAVPAAKSTYARTASNRTASAKSQKRCEQRNKIGHCTKWASAKVAKPARKV